MENANQHFERVLLDGKDQAEFFVPYRRAYMLRSAMVELRKPLVPRITGPQHGGHVALLQFYKHVTNVAETKQAEWDAEYGDEDDADE
jgi:hypothetical protein